MEKLLTPTPTSGALRLRAFRPVSNLRKLGYPADDRGREVFLVKYMQNSRADALEAGSEGRTFRGAGACTKARMR